MTSLIRMKATVFIVLAIMILVLGEKCSITSYASEENATKRIVLVHEGLPGKCSW